jgi:membrane-associated phospholipid phosphatase
MIVLLHALWTPITVVLFVLLARPWSNPLQRVASALLIATSTRGGRRALLAVGLVLVANALECLVDPQLSAWLGYDLTAWVRSVEGDLVERVQATLPAPLAPALGWFYLSGFVAGLVAPALVWTDERRFDAVRALVVGGVANYALGFVAYVFVPVREAAWSGLSDAAPLLERVYPGLSAATRIGSGLDNCMPSLHVSLTVTTLAIVAARRRPGDGPLLALAAAVAALTAYAVVALGVHWVLDVAVGAPFGLFCAWIGLALARPSSNAAAP